MEGSAYTLDFRCPSYSSCGAWSFGSAVVWCMESVIFRAVLSVCVCVALGMPSFGLTVQCVRGCLGYAIIRAYLSVCACVAWGMPSFGLTFQCVRCLGYAINWAYLSLCVLHGISAEESPMSSRCCACALFCVGVYGYKVGVNVY